LPTFAPGAAPPSCRCRDDRGDRGRGDPHPSLPHEGGGGC
jgi:hypothetical protein